MIALDTNVLVRFLVQDDPAQAVAARGLIAGCTEDAPAFIGREVLVELVWVLERAYRFGRAEIADTLDGLMAAEELVIEEIASAARAAHLYRETGGGFADLMIAAAAERAGAAALYTFDRRAARQPGVELVLA